MVDKNGCYFIKKITAIIVNATDREYITSITPTSGQMEDVELTGITV